MGLYAVLKGAEISCPECGGIIQTDWQFYFGEVANLPEYHLADRIRWRSPIRYGSPSMKLVFAVAYPNNEPACSHCDSSDILAEIKIQDCVLETIKGFRRENHLPELLYEGIERKPRFHNELRHENPELKSC